MTGRYSEFSSQHGGKGERTVPAYTGLQYKRKFSPDHIEVLIEEALIKWEEILEGMTKTIINSPDEVLLFSDKFPTINSGTFYAAFILNHKNKEYKKLYLKHNLQDYTMSLIDGDYYFGTEKALNQKKLHTLAQKYKAKLESKEQEFQELKDKLLDSMKTGDIVLNRDLKKRVGLDMDPARKFLRKLVKEGFLELVEKSSPHQFKRTNKEN